MDPNWALHLRVERDSFSEALCSVRNIRRRTAPKNLKTSDTRIHIQSSSSSSSSIIGPLVTRAGEQTVCPHMPYEFTCVLNYIIVSPVVEPQCALAQLWCEYPQVTHRAVTARQYPLQTARGERGKYRKMRNAVHSWVHTLKDTWHLRRQMSHLSVQAKPYSFFKRALLRSRTSTTSESSIDE
jgi:hypothetical protein